MVASLLERLLEADTVDSLGLISCWASLFFLVCGLHKKMCMRMTAKKKSKHITLFFFICNLHFPPQNA